MWKTPKSVSAAVTPTSSVSPRPIFAEERYRPLLEKLDEYKHEKNCCKTEAAQFDKVTLSSKERIGETHQSEVQAHQAELRKELGIVDVVLAQITYKYKLRDS